MVLESDINQSRPMLEPGFIRWTPEIQHSIDITPQLIEQLQVECGNWAARPIPTWWEN
jgi:hypothetical protein